MTTNTEVITRETNGSAKHRCPVNGVVYPGVSEKTMLHHLRAPWSARIGDERYYYCDDPNCKVMYFNERDETVTVERLRTRVGRKSRNSGGIICYCFGISAREAIENPRLRNYVAKKTQQGKCACEVRNPFGRCCLKDFPR